VFTNILGTLTSLLPKNFIFGSYIPVLIFGFINLTGLYVNSAAFRSWAYPQLVHPFNLTVAVLFVGSIVVAYILSTINDFLRELLEGKFLPGPIAKRLRYSEWRRLDQLNRDYESARTEGRKLRQQRSTWEVDLGIAAARAPAGVTGYDPDQHAAGAALHELREHRDDMKFDHVNVAVQQLKDALRRWDVDADERLRDDRDNLLNLIEDAVNIANGRELNLFAERQTSFGLLAPEPTRLGNVAGALQSYANNLYRLDLDTFWSRLQAVIQVDAQASYNALVDAKTQLDFLVACCWLDAITTVVWFVALAAFGGSTLTFVAIAIVGPLLFVAFYRLAVTNYLAYSELVRAIIDLNRFALLDRLHVARPNGIRDERRLWVMLRRVSTLGEDDVELSYEHPAK
jgi:hypothetical protein